MLEGMSMTQFQEWLAFFQIREELRTRKPDTGPPPRDQKALCLTIMQQMQGYRARRNRANGA